MPLDLCGRGFRPRNADHKHDQRGHRSINAAIGLKVPVDVIRAKCKPYLHHGKPIRRTERIVDTDFSIVTQFQTEFRGIAEYYRLAFNRHRLGRLKYVMERSLTKTLARKYRIRVAQVYGRYRAVLDTEHGPRRGLQVTVNRMVDGHHWSPGGAVSPWHVTSHLALSTTTRPASGTAAGPSWFNGYWPTPANFAGQPTGWKCITFALSRISIPRDANIHPNGSRGWRRAAARP